MNTKFSNKDLKTDDNNLLIDNIDFKELSKNCKTQDDLSNLTKEFIKNIIENMFAPTLLKYTSSAGTRYGPNIH